MDYLIEQITELLQQANTLAETVDNFKVASAEVVVRTTDGKQLIIRNRLANYGDGTIGEASNSQVAPPPSKLVACLSAGQPNDWF